MAVISRKTAVVLGPQGPQGPAGPPGLTGSTGPTGPEGPAGASFGQSPQSVVNGANHNVPTGQESSIRVTGATAAFSIGGFVFTGVNGGQLLDVTNESGQVWTLLHEDTGSTSASRLDCGGAPIVLGPKEKARFLYDGTSLRWKCLNQRKSHFEPEGFGAIGDGVTDDTASVQATINAAATISGMNKVHLPSIYAISSTIFLNGVSSVAFTGNRDSGFKWIGTYDVTNANPIPIIWMKGCEFVSWEHLTCLTDSSHPCAEGWRVTSDDTYGVSTQCQWNQCGASFVEIGWRVGGGSDANNDSHTWNQCLAYQCGRWGWEFQDTQQFCQFLLGCLSLGNFVFGSTVGISFSNKIVTGGTSVLNCSAGFFGAKDVGKVVEVVDDMGTLTRTTFTAFLTSTTMQLGATVPHDCTSGHMGSGINYGTQGAVNAGPASFPLPGQTSHGGGYIWIGGQVGNHIDSDFICASSHDGPIHMSSLSSENSRRFFVNSGAVSLSQLLMTIADLRLDGEHALQAYPMIQSLAGGRIVIRDSNLGTPGGFDANAPMVVDIATGGDAGYQGFELDNVSIASSLMPAAVFPSAWPTSIKNSRVFNFSNGIIGLGEKHTLLESGGGTFHITWQPNQCVWLQVDADTTVVFDDPSDGLGREGTMRIYFKANYTTGPWHVTWPSNLYWLQGKPYAPRFFLPSILEINGTYNAPGFTANTFTAFGRNLTETNEWAPVALVNGSNDAVDHFQAHGVVITGPTLAFQIAGIKPPLTEVLDPGTASTGQYADGFELVVKNGTAQTMTVKHNTSATTQDKIFSPTGADVACNIAVVRYNNAIPGWDLISSM